MHVEDDYSDNYFDSVPDFWRVAVRFDGVFYMRCEMQQGSFWRLPRCGGLGVAVASWIFARIRYEIVQMT